MKPKLLVINADDFGLSPDINTAIEELHRAGRITNTTLMVNEKHVDEAVKISRRNPRLGVGLHLDLCPAAGFYAMPYAQMREELQKPDVVARVVEEADRQIRKFESLGLELRHMDGHRHFHALPELFRPVMELAISHGLQTTRFIKDWILPRTPSVFLDDDFFRESTGLLQQHKVGYPQKLLIGWRGDSLADAEPGWNEFMFHVGFDDAYNFKEYKRLGSDEFAAGLQEAGLELRSFPEMAQAIRQG